MSTALGLSNFAKEKIVRVPALIFLYFFLFAFCGVPKLSAQQIPAAYRSLLKGKPIEKQIALLDSVAGSKKKSAPAEAETLLRLTIALAAANEKDSLQGKQRITLARFLRAKGENEAAVKSLDTTIAFSKAKNLPRVLAYAFNHKGLALMRMGDYLNASKAYFDGIAVAEKNNDTLILAILQQHCGSMYFYTKDFDNAIYYSKQALVLFRALRDSQSIASNLDNIGLYFSNQKQYDSAYKYQLQGLEMFREINDTIQLMVCYNNVGALLTNLKKYRESEIYLMNALQLAEKWNDQYRILTATFSLGNLYMEEGSNEKSIAQYLRSYELAVSLKDDFHTQSSALLLGEMYYRQKNYERSVFYYRIGNEIKDKLFDEEKTKAIDELSQKYETAQRVKQIELLLAEKSAANAKIERDRLLRIVFVIIGVALLAFSLIMISRYIRKKKDNRVLQEKNDAIASQKKLIEVKNREIVDSINYATRIQNAVLPSLDRLHSLFPNAFVYYRPRDIISGDFFWIGTGQGGVKYIAVADCTGHGVPGALMSMLGSSLLNQVLTKENIHRPGPILDMLHKNLIRMLNESTETRSVNDGMDIVLLMHDPVRKTVVIASADRPVYYYRNNQLETIAADKISIGSSLPKTAPYRETEIELNEPVQFYLFSDGITDQFGGDASKKFMSKRLRELILSNVLVSLTEREQAFEKAFDSWKTKTEQTDDMTLIHLVIG